MMSAPGQTRLTLDEYVRQVEQAFSDLSPQLRHRLLADLEVHLNDRADDPELVGALGTPIEYARELRTAMGLPESAPAPTPSQRRRWLLPALIGGVGLAVALAVTAVVLASSSSSPNHTLAPTPASALPTTEPSPAPALVVIPFVVGERKSAAVAQLEQAGLRVQIHTVNDKTGPAGSVIAQAPRAFTHVAAGSTVTLRIATS